MNFDVSGKLTNTGGGALVPIGTILEFAGSTAPANYLMCAGGAVSRTVYAELFAVIGTTYGSGDGSTTFNVPDRRGRVGVGAGTGGGAVYPLGGTGGSKDAVVVSHSHTASSSFSGNNMSGYCTADRLGIGDSKAVNNGVLSAQSYYDNSIGSAQYASGSHYTTKITFSGTPSGSVSTTVNSTGESGTNKNLQPYIVQNYIIRAK